MTTTVAKPAPARKRGRARAVLAHRSAVPLGLTALIFLIAFVQRPGRAWTDTRIELTANPGLFLSRVGEVWSSTADLGHVQSGQFVGYLFPMAPWYAGAHAIGLSAWVTERLWIAAVLAFAAWGVVRLLDELFDSRRGIAHFLAGALYVLNPYTIVHLSRGSVTLLAVAVLPWVLVATHRGLRRPRAWAWPAAIGLLMACSGGGVNAAVVALVLLAPLALLAYERVVLGVSGRDAVAFGWRALLCAVLGSLWWVVPVGLQGLYGADFLSFTEQPTSIWATNSMSESLRLFGYWISYLGTGASHGVPVMDTASDFLFQPLIIAATFGVPIVALGGYRVVRGWRYAPFFGLLTVVGLVVMAAGFPAGKPLNDVMTWVYDNIPATRFLRTTYKAGPLVTLGIACLGGPVVATLLYRLRRGAVRVPSMVRSASGFRPSRRGPRVSALWLLLLIPIPFVAALPLFTGKAIDAGLAYGAIPQNWRKAIHDTNRTTPPDHRLMVLPGQPYGYYDWGETFTSIAPALTRRPVLIRTILRYASPNSAQLQALVDDLVQQGRLVPGQLDPLLRLLAVGQVLISTDGDANRSGELDAASTAASLDDQRGFRRPAQTYGRPKVFTPAPGQGGTQRQLPVISRYLTPTGAPGVVRTHPLTGATVVDGDSQSLVDLAAFPGGLRTDRAVRYAADMTAGDVGSEVARGARLVFSDTNRRRAINATRALNAGPTVGAGEHFAGDVLAKQAFPRGVAGETVADYTGLRYLRSPDRGTFVLPQYRPYAAFDGRLDTTWLAAFEDKSKRWVEMRFGGPRDISTLEVHPHVDALGLTQGIAISVNGGPERRFRVHSGWNRLDLGARAVNTLRLRVTGVSPAIYQGFGGIDEVRLPRQAIQEYLRMPVVLAAQTNRLNLLRNEVDVTATRTTADFPYRAGNDVADAQADNPIDQVDPETGIRRLVTLPTPRVFTLQGWASVGPGTPDPAIDRLVGVPASWRFASSSRFEGLPSRRASSAFDGNPLTAWVGNLLPRRTPWIAVRAPAPFKVRRFQLVAGGLGAYALPRIVRVHTDQGVSPPLLVRRGGFVDLPRTVRTRSLRLNIASVRQPQGLLGGRLLRAVAIADVRIPGLRPPEVRHSGAFATTCGAVTVHAGGSVLFARVGGAVSRLDRGQPLSMQSCGPRRTIALRRGLNQLSSEPGPVMRADRLQLKSPPLQVPAATTSAQRSATVVSGGHGQDGSRDSVRLQPHGPSWLVLAESYSLGWRAWCESRSGKERSLGDPVRIDGYANGWRIGSDCVRAHFSFVPQRAATASYLASLIACIAMLVVLVVAIVRRRLGGRTVPDDDARGRWALLAPPSDALLHPHWRRLLVGAAAIGVAAGFIFALRAGLVLFVVALLFGLAGVSVRRLATVALLALLAIPILYITNPSPDLGGYFFGYADHYIYAHWVAVGAVCCLAAAAVLNAAQFRAQRHRRKDGATNGRADVDLDLSTASVGPRGSADEAAATRAP